MAIKIIKEGKKIKFMKRCPNCECVFEHEQEDVKVDYSYCLTTSPCKYNTYVVCPCCGKHLHHGYTESTLPLSNYSDTIYTPNVTGFQDLDCDKGLNKSNPEKPVVEGQFTCK